MTILSSVLAWFADPVHWSGPEGVPARVLEHVYYGALALLVGALLAVPVGLLVGHTGRGGFLVVGLANWLRSLPDLGLLILLVLLVGIGLVPVVAALVVLAVPPLLAGAYAGVRNTDRAVVDAARGMGMREHEVLLRVELPNALPLLFGGLRSAVLQVVATTSVAAYVGFGGLGRFLIDGFRAQADPIAKYTEMTAGVLLIAALALLLEAVLAGVQRAVVSPGLRAPGRGARSPADMVLRDDPPCPLTETKPETAGVNP